MSKQFRDFKSTREFVRSLGVGTSGGRHFYYQSGNKLEDTPVNPWKVYKESKKK